MIEVRYKCSCMAEEASVCLPYRSPAEGIVDWFEGTLVEAISADHHARSPLCQSLIMLYIGGKPELQS